jgi:hypothetical protein
VAIDPPVDGVESLCDCSPLLYHDYPPISEFRGPGTKVLSRKNMTPSLEDSEHKKTCVPSLSGQRGRHKTPSDFTAFTYCRINRHASRIMLYSTLYRIHITCGVLLEFSMSNLPTCVANIPACRAKYEVLSLHSDLESAHMSIFS